MWLKLKQKLRLAVALIVAAYLLLLVLFNAGNNAKVWLWPGREPELSVVIFGLLAFVLGVVLTVIVQAILAAFRGVKAEQPRSLEAEIAEMNRKASMLRTRPPTGKQP
jgi:uncharacterized integral membrane protein